MAKRLRRSTLRRSHNNGHLKLGELPFCITSSPMLSMFKLNVTSRVFLLLYLSLNCLQAVVVVMSPLAWSCFWVRVASLVTVLGIYIFMYWSLELTTLPTAQKQWQKVGFWRYCQGDITDSNFWSSKIIYIRVATCLSKHPMPIQTFCELNFCGRWEQRSTRINVRNMIWAQNDFRKWV